jgi:hypothetical protein
MVESSFRFALLSVQVNIIFDGLHFSSTKQHTMNMFNDLDTEVQKILLLDTFNNIDHSLGLLVGHLNTQLNLCDF